MKLVTHIMTGAAVGALVASLLGLEASNLMMLGGLFGAFPDLDALFSGGRKRTHRSALTHSIAASVIFTLAWAMILTAANRLLAPSPLDSFALAPSSSVVLLSIFLHAVEDSITVRGCRVLYPLSRRTYRGIVRYDDLAVNAALLIIAGAVILISLELDLSSALA